MRPSRDETPRGLAALFRVQSGHEHKLRRAIEKLNTRRRSPFARIASTHFARLVMVDHLTGMDNEPLANEPSCLFFSAEFDALSDGYLEAMSALLPSEADEIFRHCENYPGAGDPPAFRRWFHDHELRAGFSLRGNPGADVRRVRESLALRDRIIAFAVETQGSSPEELKRCWEGWRWDDAPPAPDQRPLERPPAPSTVPAPRRPPPSVVDQRDLQGNILCGYGRKWGHGAYLFMRVGEEEDARGWLGALIGLVNTAEPWRGEPPLYTTNIAFSWHGLRRLGVDKEILATFPAAFREGMHERAERLGDVGANHPRHWEKRISDAHVLVTVTARSAEARDAWAKELVADADSFGLAVSHIQKAAFLPGDREHFGFRDGISQPSIRDAKAGPWRGEGTRGEHGKPKPVAPGEFVLGYKDEGDALPREPAEIGRGGSYVVVRKLAQDVAGFWSYIAERAGPDRARQEWLAAKMVGRWRDGTPLVLSPHLPDPHTSNDPDRVNDFGYEYDADGIRCPLGAHIRRTNPRNALSPDGKLSKRHRLIRRGMPYTDDDERGLMFVCYQADIERQFEFLMSQWCLDGNVFGLGSDQDFIVGGAQGKATIQAAPPLLLPMRSFVRTRGGGYFFAPGIAAMRHIAQVG